MTTVTPETVMTVRSQQRQAAYERVVSAMVARIHREIIRRFDGQGKPVKVFALTHPLLDSLSWAARDEVAARLRADGWEVEYATWRHPFRWLNGIAVVRPLDRNP